jgi:hypothetical protein
MSFLSVLYAAGKIDDARFSKMSKRYEQEQGKNARKIKALRLELKKDESKRMVAELIDHIEVYHAEKQDDITNQRVDIHYNCIGAFDVPDRRKIPEADIIMETKKGVALSMACPSFGRHSKTGAVLDTIISQLCSSFKAESPMRVPAYRRHP